MSIFDSILNRLQQISKITNWTKEEIDLLSKHQQVNHAKLKVNGKEYDAWRIVHNRALGPGKGGIRFHPEVCEDEVKSLSFWMSLKNSLAGLPYGGGKGGVKFNPKEVDQAELEAVSRAYIDAFYPYIGQDKDVPAPDVYTNAQIMGWMVDEYEKKVGHHEPGVITGKPLELGGIALRSDSTAHGGYIVFSELMKTSPSLSSRAKSRDLSVAVQGYGNAGANMVKYLTENGYKVVAVSDSKGGVHVEGGIDYAKLQEVKDKTGSVVNFDCQKVSNEELLELKVDVLVLAALENQITAKNAGNIKAKYIIELANGPIDSTADDILFSKDIVVVPDILANAGGVVVSYFEWAQNRTGNILDEKYLEDKLVKMMTDLWNKVHELVNKHGGKIDYRTAAYIIAINRILAAERYRGNLS